MEIKLLKLLLFKMTILSFRDFMKKNNLKNDNMNEPHLQRVFNYPIYPRDSKKYSIKRFNSIDNGFQGGTQWTCFIIQDNKAFYFDSSGGQPDIFLLNQIPTFRKCYI